MSNVVKYIDVDQIHYSLVPLGLCPACTDNNYVHTETIYCNTFRLIVDQNGMVLYIVYKQIFGIGAYYDNIMCFDKSIYDRIIPKRSFVYVMYANCEYFIDDQVELFFKTNIFYIRGVKRYGRIFNKKCLDII